MTKKFILNKLFVQHGPRWSCRWSGIAARAAQMRGWWATGQILPHRQNSHAFSRAASLLFLLKSYWYFDTKFAKIGHPVTESHDLLWPEVNPKSEILKHFVPYVAISGQIYVKVWWWKKNFTLTNRFVQHGPAGLVDGQGLRPAQPRWEGDKRDKFCSARKTAAFWVNPKSEIFKMLCLMSLFQDRWRRDHAWQKTLPRITCSFSTVPLVL